MIYGRWNSIRPRFLPNPILSKINFWTSNVLLRYRKEVFRMTLIKCGIFVTLPFLWRRQHKDQRWSWPGHDRIRLRPGSDTHNVNISRNLFAKWVSYRNLTKEPYVRSNGIPTTNELPGYKKYSGYWHVPGLVMLRVAWFSSPDSGMALQDETPFRQAAWAGGRSFWYAAVGLCGGYVVS